MNGNFAYLLMPVMAILLVSAQATWGTAIKRQHLLEGPFGKVLGNLLTSPRIWLGILIYTLATAVYFVLLSRVKFFSVQVTMTAIAIIFSTLLAAFLFDEKLSPLNILGMIVVLVGIGFVLSN